MPSSFWLPSFITLMPQINCSSKRTNPRSASPSRLTPPQHLLQGCLRRHLSQHPISRSSPHHHHHLQPLHPILPHILHQLLITFSMPMAANYPWTNSSLDRYSTSGNNQPATNSAGWPKATIQVSWELTPSNSFPKLTFPLNLKPPTPASCVILNHTRRKPIEFA